MTRKLPLTLRVVVAYILCFGVVSGIASLDYETLPTQSARTTSNVTNAVTAKTTEVTSEVPRRIWLPRLNIELSVLDGQYDHSTKQWTLTDDSLHYAVMTSRLSDKPGNTLIYGHNSPQVLQPTKNLKEGDLLEVTAESGRVLTYLFKDDKYVLPTDTAVLYEKPDKPQLTLMTCDANSSDKYRRLMRFELMDVT